ncbi:RNA polymerase sigma factor [Frankia sp. R82]|uniref:RNA polymerase sigma factor n=1 Tax=Frankia sp. R82 TaxID=2950553 RepID=UPI002044B7DC|nr:RNA polymerase sigma factor [Frankia sp. R82]MCM3883070.1 RNA polymerase sigma factor [Frankia sp. R82]
MTEEQVSSPPIPTGANETDTRASLTALYLEHYQQLVGVACRYLGDGSREDGEDVVQDAYLRVWARWDQVDPRTGRAYLFRAVANLACSAVRRRAVAASHRPSSTAVSASAEETALSGLLPAGIVTAIGELPPRERQAVLLRHYLDLGQHAAATAMHCTPATVRGYTFRALATLARQAHPPADTARAA